MERWIGIDLAQDELVLVVYPTGRRAPGRMPRTGDPPSSPLPVRSTIYRVFLLPGALQVDLFFTPIAEFGARGSRFRLLFGEADAHTWAPPSPPSPEHEFGLGIHHVVRAHICIERGRLWQAEYWAPRGARRPPHPRLPPPRP